MASAADIPGAFALVSMPFGIAFKRPEAVIRKRNRRIDTGEPGRVFAASFDVDFVVETFLGEVAVLVGDPVVQPAVRLDNEFRHIYISLSLMVSI
jgi:hypothetical protein